MKSNLLVISARSQKVNKYQIAAKQFIYSQISVSTAMVALVEHTDRTQIFFLFWDRLFVLILPRDHVLHARVQRPIND